MLQTFKESNLAWSALINALRRYFRGFGGFRAIFSSPFFQVSLLISIISSSEWRNNEWYNTVTDILPNIIGISISIYAILFSLLNDKLRSALQNTFVSEKITNLESLNSVFFHFIITQVVALIWAVTYKSNIIWEILKSCKLNNEYINIFFDLVSNCGAMFGYFLFIYSLVQIIAAAIAIYRIASIKIP